MQQQLQKSAGLTPEQLTAIQALESLCNRSDGLTMKLNMNTLARRPADEINDFLYYTGDELIGYLALYIFNKHEAEVSAMVHPDFRRHGIFKQLVAAAREEVKQRGLPDLLFICERASATGALAVKAIGAGYDFSEYKMELQQFIPAGKAEITLRPATMADLAAMAEMDALCFNADPDSARVWIERGLTDNQRGVWAAQLGPALIGKIQITRTGEETFINAFCVRPEYRGKGYGKAILSRMVAQLLAEQHPLISLEVATENENALSLYQRIGFQVTTAYDYYRLPVQL